MANESGDQNWTMVSWMFCLCSFISPASYSQRDGNPEPMEREPWLKLTNNGILTAELKDNCRRL
jgi:hypothetical protein